MTANTRCFLPGSALLTGILMLLTGFSGWCADLPNAKDHPLFKRFGGSEIVGYDNKRFDSYELQTSTFRKYDLSAKRRLFVQPPQQLEGGVTRIWYEARGKASAAELAGNYRNELTEQGFQILYDSAKDPNAGNWSGFLNSFGEIAIQTNRKNYVFMAADNRKIRVLSAKKERPEGDLYFSMTAVEWAKDDAVYMAHKGAYAAVDLIEVRPMKQNMVTVKAEEMAEAINLTGRIALYGIYFDTDQATIKPDSRPALQEIAKLLQQQPQLSLHVVGHTDSQGSLDHNLGLSKRRAEAVKNALIRDFGVAAGRLTPNGVASLAPVATNGTEEGRAKNRRVELVPR